MARPKSCKLKHQKLGFGGNFLRDGHSVYAELEWWRTVMASGPKTATSWPSILFDVPWNKAKLTSKYVISFESDLAFPTFIKGYNLFWCQQMCKTLIWHSRQTWIHWSWKSILFVLPLFPIYRLLLQPLSLSEKQQIPPSALTNDELTIGFERRFFVLHVCVEINLVRPPSRRQFFGCLDPSYSVTRESWIIASYVVV